MNDLVTFLAFPDHRAIRQLFLGGPGLYFLARPGPARPSPGPYLASRPDPVQAPIPRPGPIQAAISQPDVWPQWRPAARPALPRRALVCESER